MAGLKMFDVGNTSRTGFFCLAESKEQAAEIACAAGHVKSAENARCHELDLDDVLKKDSAAESLRKLVAEGKPGRLIKELPALTLSRRMFGIAKQSADSGKKIKKENGGRWVLAGCDVREASLHPSNVRRTTAPGM